MSDLDIRDALDLPPELRDVQDAYWDARREWQRLDSAYQLVIENMLARLAASQEASR